MILSREEVIDAFKYGRTYVNASMLLYNSLPGDMVLQLLMCYCETTTHEFTTMMYDEIKTNFIPLRNLMVSTFKEVMASDVSLIESLTREIITLSCWVLEEQDPSSKLPREVFGDMICILKHKSAKVMFAQSIRKFFTALANIFCDSVQDMRSLVTASSCTRDIPAILTMVAQVDALYLAIFMKEHAVQTSVWVDAFIFTRCGKEKIRAIDMVSNTLASPELLVHAAVSDYMCDQVCLRREICYEDAYIAAIDHHIDTPQHNGVILHFNTYPRICKTTRYLWNRRIDDNRSVMSDFEDCFKTILTRRIERQVCRMIGMDSHDIFEDLRLKCGVGGMSFDEICQHVTNDSLDDHIFKYNRCLLSMFQVSVPLTNPLRERIINSLGEHVNSILSQTRANYPNSVFTSSSSLYQRRFVVGVHTRTMYDDRCFMKVNIQKLDIRKTDMEGITSLGRRMPKHNQYLSPGEKVDTKKHLRHHLVYGSMHLLPHVHKFVIPFTKSTCVFEIQSLKREVPILLQHDFDDYFCVVVSYEMLCEHPLLSRYLDDSGSSLLSFQYKEVSMRNLTSDEIFIRTQDLKYERQIYIACSYSTSYVSDVIYLHVNLYSQVQVLHMNVEPCR